MQNHLRKIRGRSITKKDRKQEGEFSLDAVVEDNSPSPDKNIFAGADS
jgi:hypothetical protein